MKDCYKRNKKGGTTQLWMGQQSTAKSSHMHLRYVIAGIYIAFGLLQYSAIGGVGAELEGKKGPPLWRKVLVILLWPLAMIGAIEG